MAARAERVVGKCMASFIVRSWVVPLDESRARFSKACFFLRATRRPHSDSRSVLFGCRECDSNRLYGSRFCFLDVLKEGVLELFLSEREKRELLGARMIEKESSSFAQRCYINLQRSEELRREGVKTEKQSEQYLQSLQAPF